MAKRGLTIKNKFQDDLIPPDGTKTTKHPYLQMESCNFPCCNKPAPKPGIPWNTTIVKDQIQ